MYSKFTNPYYHVAPAVFPRLTQLSEPFQRHDGLSLVYLGVNNSVGTSSFKLRVVVYAREILSLGYKIIPYEREVVLKHFKNFRPRRERGEIDTAALLKDPFSMSHSLRTKKKRLTFLNVVVRLGCCHCQADSRQVVGHYLQVCYRAHRLHIHPPVQAHYRFWRRRGRRG